MAMRVMVFAKGVEDGGMDGPPTPEMLEAFAAMDAFTEELVKAARLNMAAAMGSSVGDTSGATESRASIRRALIHAAITSLEYLLLLHMEKLLLLMRSRRMSPSCCCSCCSSCCYYFARCPCCRRRRLGASTADG
jgi:hypothetical protein